MNKMLLMNYIPVYDTIMKLLYIRSKNTKKLYGLYETYMTEEMRFFWGFLQTVWTPVISPVCRKFLWLSRRVVLGRWKQQNLKRGKDNHESQINKQKQRKYTFKTLSFTFFCIIILCEEMFTFSYDAVVFILVDALQNFTESSTRQWRWFDGLCE